MSLQHHSTKWALDLSPQEWHEWCLSKGFPPFLAKQIVDWIYQKGVLNPQKFTNLSLSARHTLEKEFRWQLLEIDSQLLSQDKSEKFLVRTEDTLLIEMVLMPSEKRTTLCISCQVGCKMGCTFCQTGKMGFKRNLSSGEITAQLFLKCAFEKQERAQSDKCCVYGDGRAA